MQRNFDPMRKQVEAWQRSELTDVDSGETRLCCNQLRRNSLLAMVEAGLVRFAQVALDVAQVTVPRYRTCFSKRQFSQPQLLAILCLMRYEDWTFREAEVRLSEHRELRLFGRLPKTVTPLSFEDENVEDAAAAGHKDHAVPENDALDIARKLRETRSAGPW